MASDPRITVIIPIRNEAAFITACLQSLLADPLADDSELLVYNEQVPTSRPRLFGSYRSGIPK